MLRRFALFVALIALFAAPMPHTHAQTSTLTLTDCELPIGAQGTQKQAAKCGVLSVPEDYSTPDGRQIEIHVAVVPARNSESRRAPIFHFEGGPGASAIEYYGLAWYSAYVDLNEQHDIVLIDQRGTGKSASLQCTEITNAAFDDLARDLSPETELEESKQRLAACLTRLAATNDPQHYITANLARDTDAVRAALGYEKINLFGSSYGTWLGQFYLRQFGANVNAAVLEGTVGPWDKPFLLANTHAEAAIQRVFDLCAADAACNRAYPDLNAKLAQALARLQTPVRVTGTSSLTGKSYPVVLNAPRLLTALRTMPYQASLIGSLPQAVSQAASGTYTLPATVLIAAAEQPISYGMNLSIVCAEDAAFYTEALLESIPQSAMFSGVPTDTYTDVCRVWRSAELEAADVAPISSDVPTLFLSGDFDPITPPAFTEATQARFPNSSVARFPNQGHTILPNNLCAQRLVSAFYTDPSLHDTACTANDAAIAFVGALRFDYETFIGEAFSVRVPKGWQNDGTGGGMLFFSSTEGEGAPDLLGVALYDVAGGAPLQKAAFESISGRYRNLSEQATIAQLGVTIAQYTFSTDQEVYIGALITFGFGGQSRAVWYAAPANRFTAGFSSVAVEVFGSIFPR